MEKILAQVETAPLKLRGQLGMMINELMPHLTAIAVDICLMRGMNSDNP
jgi:hypothetical protein